MPPPSAYSAFLHHRGLSAVDYATSIGPARPRPPAPAPSQAPPRSRLTAPAGQATHQAVIPHVHTQARGGYGVAESSPHRQLPDGRIPGQRCSGDLHLHLSASTRSRPYIGPESLVWMHTTLVSPIPSSPSSLSFFSSPPTTSGLPPTYSILDSLASPCLASSSFARSLPLLFHAPGPDSMSGQPVRLCHMQTRMRSRKGPHACMHLCAVRCSPSVRLGQLLRPSQHHTCPRSSSLKHRRHPRTHNPTRWSGTKHLAGSIQTHPARHAPALRYTAARHADNDSHLSPCVSRHGLSHRGPQVTALRVNTQVFFFSERELGLLRLYLSDPVCNTETPRPKSKTP